MALTEISAAAKPLTNITGPYNDALLYEDGVHFRDAEGAAYTRVCRIKNLLPAIRAAEAVRILPVSFMTRAVEDSWCL